MLSLTLAGLGANKKMMRKRVIVTVLAAVTAAVAAGT